MGITALFFNFSKRKNSTKVPLDTDGTSFDVYLKQPCSFQEPVLTLNNSGFSYNYAKFEGSYYFVSDVVSLRTDLWEVHLTKDVLATWKSGILATSAYVLYDTVGNSDIIDSRLAVDATPSVSSNTASFPGIDSSIGRFILTAVGKDSCASWAIPYRMNPASIVNSVYVNNTLNTIDEPALPWSDTSTDTLTALQALGDLVDKIYTWFVAFQKKAWTQQLSSGDAMDAIRSCIWLPFDFSVDASDTAVIYLGNYDTGYAGTKLGGPNNPAIKTLSTATVNIPWQHSDFRRSEPYTKLYLYIPFIGVINLSASSLMGSSSLSVTPALNVISGDLSVRVSCGSQTIGTYGANVAVNVPLGSSNVTPKELFNSLIAGATGVAAAAAAGSAGAAGAAALAGLAGFTMTGLTGHPSSVGGLSSGSAAGLLQNIVCFSVCHDTVITPSAVGPVIGLPSFYVKTISSLTGYVQTSQFSLDAAAPAADREAVNNLMDSGVYIE